MLAKGSPLVVLELGDFLNTDTWMGPAYNEYLLDRMEAEGMQAMTPGVRELSNYGMFEALLADRAIEVVCSNVAILHDGLRRPVGRRTHIITVNGVRIGLIGVLGAEEFGKVTPPAGLQFDHQPAHEAIAALAPDLKAACDLVVVLAAVNDKDATKLAGQVENVDILLGGYFSIASRNALQIGEVIVSRCGLRGIYFATTRVIVNPQGEIVDWYGYNYELDARVPDDPTIAAQVAEVEQRAQELRRHAIMERAAGLKSSAPAIKYLGVATCRSCHAAQFAQWRSTPHARAMETLKEAGRDRDPHCVGCHITRPPGTPDPGLDRATVDPAFHHVQCEACHGPGSEHRRGAGMAAVVEAVCLGCHTAEWSPRWHYEAALERVRH